MVLVVNMIIEQFCIINPMDSYWYGLFILQIYVEHKEVG